jgi:hypothetical protein
MNDLYETVPTLQIEDGVILNVKDVFNHNGDEIPYIDGSIFNGASYRTTKVVLPEESAFVYVDGKKYWGIVLIEQTRNAHGSNTITMEPCAESQSKAVGLRNKYWWYREEGLYRDRPRNS